jgi:hypothetical protein
VTSPTLCAVSDVVAIALACAALSGAPSAACERDPQVIVTHPRGFAWPEALAGAVIAATAVALAAGAAELRHRSTQPKGRP